MINKRKIIKSTLFFFLIFCISTSLIFILNVDHFLAYLASNTLPGWDGPNHLVVGEIYKDQIFPRFWGWIPQWFGGMPFPQFYPPTFYFITALLSTITTLSYLVLVKLFVIILFVSIPVSIFFFTRVLVKNLILSALAFLISIITLSTFNDLGSMGLTIKSLMNSAMVSQLFALSLLIPWYYFFRKVEYSVFSQYISGFLLFLIFISNVHIVPFVAVLFFAQLVVVLLNNKENIKTFSDTYKSVKLYFLIGTLPLLLASFWYIPLINYYFFSPAIAMNLNFMEPVELFKSIFIPFVFAISSLFIALKKRDSSMLVLSFSVIVVVFLSISEISKLFSKLPFHVERWLIIIILFFPIFIVYVLNYIWGKTKSILILILLSFSIIFYIGASFYIGNFYKNYDGFYFDYEKDDIEGIVEYLKDKEGIINVETFFPFRQNSNHFIDSVLAENGIKTTFVVFRESSINAIFMAPVRNSLSAEVNFWPSYRSLLGDDMDFFNQGIEGHIDRAKFMGVKYLLNATNSSKKSLAVSGLVNLEKDFGQWTLFSIKEDVSRAEILEHKPIAAFTHLNFKEKDFDSYDFTRIGEEAFFQNKLFPIFFHPKDLFLDTTDDLDLAGGAFIFHYKYRDESSAFSRLKKFSENKKLVLVEDPDEPLFVRLSEISLENNNIKVIPKIKNSSSVRQSRIELKNVLDFFSTTDPDVTDFAKVGFTELDSKVLIDFDQPTPKEVPVLIKVSYFPTWERSDGQNVYMATPAYMLTYANDDFELIFKTPKSVYLGYTVSGIIFIIVLITLGRHLKKKSLFISSKNKI